MHVAALFFFFFQSNNKCESDVNVIVFLFKNHYVHAYVSSTMSYLFPLYEILNILLTVYTKKKLCCITVSLHMLI